MTEKDIFEKTFNDYKLSQYQNENFIDTFMKDFNSFLGKCELAKKEGLLSSDLEEN